MAASEASVHVEMPAKGDGAKAAQGDIVAEKDKEGAAQVTN
jgi:hypothetical protein